MSAQPTVVLFHGAFASFAPVISRLLADGMSVMAPAVPNRGLVTDAAYIASVAQQIPGPVLLVGHSYGGAVITVAGAADNVVGLVYVAAYVLDEGESIAELQGAFPDVELAKTLVYRHFPQPGQEDGTDVYVDIDAFPSVLAAGIDPQQARILAVSQRPLAAAAFTQPATTAAWRTKPSWGLVAMSDRAINPDVERFGYSRGSMTVTEVDTSHLVMLVDPAAVVDVIREALRAMTFEVGDRRRDHVT